MTTRQHLLQLMNLPLSKFESVIRTSDGNYIAQVKGDVGYNAFLGKPSPPHTGPGRDRMLQIWNKLTAQEQHNVLTYAAHPVDGVAILLHRDFGVPKLGSTQ